MEHYCATHLISLTNCGKPVRDRDGRTASTRFIEGVLNNDLRVGVKSGSAEICVEV